MSSAAVGMPCQRLPLLLVACPPRIFIKRLDIFIYDTQLPSALNLNFNSGEIISNALFVAGGDTVVSFLHVKDPLDRGLWFAICRVGRGMLEAGALAIVFKPLPL
eukprot:6185418-Pleurochrysis_carterae.AAC.1